ncbi:HNH endonuclease signature motif containing protein [Arthrobacter subterraneus]|uniref:HNH endonuclease signature motif containing protein n=1 Tax=Arthrobacter subterraneus TaxID=335973 RepID=UPI0037FF38D9
MPWSVSDAELEQAYAEADRPWLEMPLGQALGLDWDDEFDDGRGPDERDRAAMDSASAYELVARLQDVPSPESRQSRTITDALNLLRAVDRLSSWAASRQAFLLAEVFDQIRSLGGTRRGEPGNGAVDPQLIVTLAAQEIAPLLRVPGRTAQRMLGDAVRLTEELPGTWKALEEGRVSPVQAQVLVEESGSLPVEALPRFEEAVLETAGGLTRPKLARRCRRVREELHPETITVRRVRAVQERCVSVQPEQDGMAWLGAYLPAEQAHGIFNRVDAAARSLQGPTEPRTLSQLRADVFADVLTHTCQGDPKKGTGFRGIGASVFVTVPVMTLLGHKRSDWQNLPTDAKDTTDHGTGAGAGGGKGFGGNSADAGAAASSGAGGPDVSGCENGLLDGYGPIDPDTARSLAAHAPSFTRILVHPETGAVLSVGRDRYRPPKHLQDWVRITHPTCMHPGCNRSSWTCEIDHLTPWAHGGHTALGNLGPKCKLHHMMKTEGIWPAGTDQHGTPHTTSLGGKTYTTLPEPPPPF